MKLSSTRIATLIGTSLFLQNVIAADTKITVGGEIKLDAYHDSSTNNSIGPRGYDLLSFRSIPLDGSGDSEKSGGTKLHARATKFFVQSDTPFSGGNIKTYIEGDFLGRVDTGADTDDDTISNSYEFRLRQAYVSWGNWMAGQAWTNFVDLKAFPEGLTFTSILGRAFGRQAQLRYTYPLGGGDRIAFSLENPDTDHNAGTPPPGSNANEDDTIPDIIGTYFNQMGKNHFRASFVVRSLGVDNTGTVTDLSTAQSDRATGWGIGLSSKFFLSDSINIKLNLNGGDGIGRYLFNNQFRSSTFIDGNLQTEEAWGGNVMVQYKPSKKFRMNLGFGGHSVDVDSDLIAGSVTEKLTSIHANGIWTIAPSLEVGAGFTHATREVKNGTEGDLTRLMFTVKRKFRASF